MKNAISEAVQKRPTGNLLLDALPSEELRQIESKLKRVALEAQQVLSTQGQVVKYVYFPATGFVSCRAIGSQGESLEIYAIGNDGVVEPAAILTGVAAVNAEVQIAGEAYRISIDELCSVIQHTVE